MNPVISLCDVVMWGAFDPDGETLTKCRISMAGVPTDAVLYSKDVDEDRWRRVDRLTKATVTERPDGTLSIEGTSQELVEVVGTTPENATVRWDVTPRGCRNCG